MKRCPRCSELLIRRRVLLIEVDGCNGCGGVFLDAGELQTLSGDPESLAKIEELFRPGLKQSLGGGPTGACPVDGGKLREFEYKTLRGVRLDRCPTCEGVF